MKLLESIIQDLFDYRESFKGKKVNSNYKKDLTMLACLKIYKHYMILPPTPRNVQIMENLLVLYPDLTIDTDYDPENRVTLDLFHVLNRSLSDNTVSVKDVITKLRNNCIIIEKNEDINDFLDAAKVGNALLSGKRYVIKQIGFFAANGPRFNTYNKSLSDKLNKTLNAAGSNFEICYINVNGDHSLSLKIRAHGKVEQDFDLNKLKKVSAANEFRKSLNDKIKNNLNFEIPLDHEKISFDKITRLYVPRSDYDKFYNDVDRRNIYSNSEYVRKKTGVELLHSEDRLRSNRKVETWFDVRGISLDNFYDYIRTILQPELSLSKTPKIPT